MMGKRLVTLPRPLYLCAAAAVGGYEEERGPLGAAFDFIDRSDRFGKKTWETAEGEMSRIALNLALKKAGLSHRALSLLVAGDLQNQCVASAGGLFSFGIPYVGLYGACSTLTEGFLVLASFLSTAEEYSLGAVVTSSHNAAAERQFRSPLEYGGQRAPTAQWTATAAGAYLLGKAPSRVKLTAFLPGKAADGAIADASNMGAAMAPAAADTILTYFEESGETPEDVDLILTGDLGRVGSGILREILDEKMPGLSARHTDCGLWLYDASRQDVHSGASGCGCSAAVFATKFLPALEAGRIRSLLLLSTGALMSPSSVQQKEHILGIAPLAVFRYNGR